MTTQNKQDTFISLEHFFVNRLARSFHTEVDYKEFLDTAIYEVWRYSEDFINPKEVFIEVMSNYLTLMCKEIDSEGMFKIPMFEAGYIEKLYEQACEEYDDYEHDDEED